ncbi:hypothetical protein CRENBAI_013720 [Crenichthys baileyi]|uniref:Uncharacterized protein n=1 Tax=Crenichthys baileyi TaxID=28760 RepID=A0AAV9RFB9_9TELE
MIVCRRIVAMTHTDCLPTSFHPHAIWNKNRVNLMGCFSGFFAWFVAETSVKTLSKHCHQLRQHICSSQMDSSQTNQFYFLHFSHSAGTTQLAFCPCATVHPQYTE